MPNQININMFGITNNTAGSSSLTFHLSSAGPMQPSPGPKQFRHSHPLDPLVWRRAEDNSVDPELWRQWHEYKFEQRVIQTQRWRRHQQQQQRADTVNRRAYPTPPQTPYPIPLPDFDSLPGHEESAEVDYRSKRRRIDALFPADDSGPTTTNLTPLLVPDNTLDKYPSSSALQLPYIRFIDNRNDLVGAGAGIGIDDEWADPRTGAVQPNLQRQRRKDFRAGGDDAVRKIKLQWQDSDTKQQEKDVAREKSRMIEARMERQRRRSQWRVVEWLWDMARSCAEGE